MIKIGVLNNFAERVSLMSRVEAVPWLVGKYDVVFGSIFPTLKTHIEKIKATDRQKKTKIMKKYGEIKKTRPTFEGNEVLFINDVRSYLHKVPNLLKLHELNHIQEMVNFKLVNTTTNDGKDPVTDTKTYRYGYGDVFQFLMDGDPSSEDGIVSLLKIEDNPFYSPIKYELDLPTLNQFLDEVKADNDVSAYISDLERLAKHLAKKVRKKAGEDEKISNIKSFIKLVKKYHAMRAMRFDDGMITSYIERPNGGRGSDKVYMAPMRQALTKELDTILTSFSHSLTKSRRREKPKSLNIQGLV